MTDNTEGTAPEQEPLKLTGYSMKRKLKDVPILNAIITKTKKGAFMASGVDSEGNKMTTLLGSAKALACIEAGLATKGWED